MRTGFTFVGLAVMLTLSACNRSSESLSPEELARETHAMIVSGANTLLLGDRLGYDTNDDEVERVNTSCEGEHCAIGFFTRRRAGDVSVEGSDLTLLGERRGVTLVQEERSLSWADSEGYGGWLEHSLFTTEQTLYTDSAEIDPDHGVTVITSRSLGFSSGENPSAGEGSARWEGLMVGRDLRASPSRGQVIRGDADVTVDFAVDGITAAVEFTDIVNIETGDPHDDMAWPAMAVQGGAFARRNAPDNTLSGRFYGAGEEEVGGVFERDGTAGAFGARRTAVTPAPGSPMVPATADATARATYARIVDGANAVLAGDQLGYSGTDDAIERTATRCLVNVCSTAFSRFIRPNRFSVESVDLELLGERRGVSLVIERESGEYTDVHFYGGWLEHSFFGTQSNLNTNNAFPDWGASVVQPYSVGFSTGENPSGVGSSARWEGLMIGRDLRGSASRGQVLLGIADVTVDFAAGGMTAVVAFTEIANTESGERWGDMAWTGMAVEGGGFMQRQAVDDVISGRFFGPNEEEVGGIFERDGVSGAFGGRRTSN